MTKETYKEYTIKQKKHSIGFAMMVTYDVLNNSKLVFNAWTVREAKEKIDNLTKKVAWKNNWQNYLKLIIRNGIALETKEGRSNGKKRRRSDLFYELLWNEVNDLCFITNTFREWS